MKTSNLMKTIGVGVALATGLAGTAYGGTKEDLDAVRDYVEANPTVRGSINDVPFRGITTKSLSTYATEDATWIELNVNGNTLYFCDNNSNGRLDGIGHAESQSRGDKAFALMDCLSPETNEITEKRQGNYEQALKIFRKYLNI